MTKSMNAGKLRAFTEVLHYSEDKWRPLFTAYGAYKRLQRVIYSRHAVAVPGAQFLMRETGVDPHMAIRYDGRFFLITEVEPAERGFIHVTTAEVEPKWIFGFRREQTQGSLNRPVVTDEALTPFYGIIAERYVRAEQEAPQSEITTTLVLTTPKSVLLKPGDRLMCRGLELCDERESALDLSSSKVDYRVVAAYPNVDKYRADYEIIREDEA